MSRRGHMSPLAIALRSTGLGSNEPQTTDRRLLLMSGLWGLALGPVLMAGGAILGTLIINALLGAFSSGGTVVMPTVVLGVAYGGALYGGLITLTASARLLCSIWPAAAGTSIAGRVVRLGIAVILGFAELIAVWALIHMLGLAEFQL